MRVAEINLKESNNAVIPFIGQVAAKPTINKLLSAVSSLTYSQISPLLQKVSLKTGQTIYHPEDPIDFVYFPETVIASRLSLMEDGSTVEVGLIGNDGVVGISSFIGAKRARSWTVVDVGGHAYRMRASLFMERVRTNADFRSVIANYYHSFFMQVSQRAVCRCRHSLMEQFCSWLLMFKDRFNSNKLPLTHEHIARRLGTRRASVTVAASELKKEGVIDYSRGFILIADSENLKAQSCECYTVLKDDILLFYGEQNIH